MWEINKEPSKWATCTWQSMINMRVVCKRGKSCARQQSREEGEAKQKRVFCHPNTSPAPVWYRYTDVSCDSVHCVTTSCSHIGRNSGLCISVCTVVCVYASESEPLLWATIYGVRVAKVCRSRLTNFKTNTHSCSASASHCYFYCAAQLTEIKGSSVGVGVDLLTKQLPSYTARQCTSYFVVHIHLCVGWIVKFL